MTHRRELEHHRRSLEEISGIMNSMKTLSYMESRKLQHFLNAQQAVVRSIEEAATELLSFHSEILPEPAQTCDVHILIGSERGFCGDFNHVIRRKMDTLSEPGDSTPAKFISIGDKLNTLLEQDEIDATKLPGASMAEEVPERLNEVTNTLTELQNQYGLLTVFCHYHAEEQDIRSIQLLPPFEDCLAQPPRFTLPPELNMAPETLLVELIDQYLFAALHEMLYTSLMVENHLRITHLEGAVQHLNDETEELSRKSNALRQEEIIEEIEVILLSSANLDESVRHRALPGSS